MKRIILLNRNRNRKGQNVAGLAGLEVRITVSDRRIRRF